jgi:hypothetical protein
MITYIFCLYLQNRLIQTSQTGGQWYSDTSPFSIPWSSMSLFRWETIINIGQHFDQRIEGQSRFTTVIFRLLMPFQMLQLLITKDVRIKFILITVVINE